MKRVLLATLWSIALVVATTSVIMYCVMVYCVMADIPPAQLEANVEGYYAMAQVEGEAAYEWLEANPDKAQAIIGMVIYHCVMIVWGWLRRRRVKLVAREKGIADGQKWAKEILLDRCRALGISQKYLDCSFSFAKVGDDPVYVLYEDAIAAAKDIKGNAYREGADAAHHACELEYLPQIETLRSECLAAEQQRDAAQQELLWIREFCKDERKQAQSLVQSEYNGETFDLVAEMHRKDTIYQCKACEQAGYAKGQSEVDKARVEANEARKKVIELERVLDEYRHECRCIESAVAEEPIPVDARGRAFSMVFNKLKELRYNAKQIAQMHEEVKKAALDGRTAFAAEIVSSLIKLNYLWYDIDHIAGRMTLGLRPNVSVVALPGEWIAKLIDLSGIKYPKS